MQSDQFNRARDIIGGYESAATMANVALEGERAIMLLRELIGTPKQKAACKECDGTGGIGQGMSQVLCTDCLGTGDGMPAEVKPDHELKTDPAVFEAVRTGAKTHEIRLDDRNFKVGERLLLLETEFTGQQMREEGKPLNFTGRKLIRTISHVLSGYGLMPNWVILSLEPQVQEVYCGCGDQIMPDDGARCGTCVSQKYQQAGGEQP